MVMPPTESLRLLAILELDSLQVVFIRRFGARKPCRRAPRFRNHAELNWKLLSKLMTGV